MKNNIRKIVSMIVCFVISGLLLFSSVSLVISNLNVKYQGNINFMLGETYYLAVKDNVDNIYSSNEEICNFTEISEEEIYNRSNLIYFVNKEKQEKKYFRVQLNGVGSCYMSIETMDKVTDIYDVVIKFDYSVVDFIDIYDGNETTKIATSRVNKTGEYLSQGKDTFNFEFGKVYTIRYNDHLIGEYENSVVINTTASCILSDGTVSKEMDLNEKGKLIVWGINNGTFRLFSDIYGGFEFDYTISFNDTTLLNDLYNMYYEMYGSSINSPTQLSFDFYKDIKKFKVSRMPSNLTKEMFDIYFNNVDEIIVSYNYTNADTFKHCYIPSNITKVTLENYSKYSVFENVKFSGESYGELDITINGAFKLYSSESSVFTQFKTLKITTNTLNYEQMNSSDKYLGTLGVQQTYIYSKKGTNCNTIAGIGNMELVINHPTVIVGADGVGSFHNAEDDYTAKGDSYASALRSANPTSGWAAIAADIINVTANTSFACAGGTGGSRQNPEQTYYTYSSGNGADGVDGGDGANGCCAISGKELRIADAEGKVVFYGGDGGFGADGTNGTDGADIFATDTDGGDGGDGGNGGNGASPLRIANSIINNSNHLILHAGRRG